MGRSGGHTRESMLADRYMRRWLVQCARCQQMGYRGEIPDSGDRLRIMRKLFPELTVNAAGLCPDCESRAPSATATAR